MTLASGGLWLPVWALLTFVWHGWKCTRCGSRIATHAVETFEDTGRTRTSWIVRHFERYARLKPWPFVVRVTFEGLVVGLMAAMLLRLFGFRRDSLSEMSTGELFLFAVVIAPMAETLVFQSLPVFAARLLGRGYAGQLVAGWMFFAIAHFFDGVAAGVAAGVVGGFYYAFTYVHWSARSFSTALWTTAASHALHNLIPVLLTILRKGN